MFEWLADAQHVSANNPNDLPAYTTYDAGVTAQLTRGTLTLRGHEHQQYLCGRLFEPGQRGAVHDRRRLRDSEHRAAIDAAHLLADVLGEVRTRHRVADCDGVSRARFGGGGGLFGGGIGRTGRAGRCWSSGWRPGGGFRSLFSPLPQTPPADPFAVGANPQTCSAENAGKARQLSAELKAYQAQIEAARTAAGYPATMPAPALADATVTYHGLGTTYALAVTPKGSGMLRVVAGCMSLHIARADDVTQRKLYAASNPIFFVPQLTFMPAVGMYIVARQPQAGQEMFRVYKLPTTPPKDPFELRASTSCTGAVRNLATPSMAELAKHFTANAATPSWTITRACVQGGTWYELEPGDPTVIPGVDALRPHRRNDRRGARFARLRREGRAGTQLHAEPRPVSRAAGAASVTLTLAVRENALACAPARPFRACAGARRGSSSPTIQSAAPDDSHERESTRRSYRP